MKQLGKQVTKRVSLTFASLLLVLFATFVHTAVRPMEAHAMGGMEHGSSTPNCASLCTSAVFKQDENKIVEQERNDELEPTPFTPELSRVYFENLYNFTCDNPAPPSKIPIYKLCMVFRR